MSHFVLHFVLIVSAPLVLCFSASFIHQFPQLVLGAINASSCSKRKIHLSNLHFFNEFTCTFSFLSSVFWHVHVCAVSKWCQKMILKYYFFFHYVFFVQCRWSLTQNLQIHSEVKKTIFMDLCPGLRFLVSWFKLF